MKRNSHVKQVAVLAFVSKYKDIIIQKLVEKFNEKTDGQPAATDQPTAASQPTTPFKAEDEVEDMEIAEKESASSERKERKKGSRRSLPTSRVKKTKKEEKTKWGKAESQQTGK